MSLKVLREERGLTRKELAECSGLSLRSIQDYEQGHKNVASMKGESLFKLSVALGCTVEDILNDYICPEEEEVEEADKRRFDDFSRRELLSRKVYCEEYNIYGKWLPRDGYIELVFMYQGELVRLATNAEVNDKTLPWLGSVAAMAMEDYVEQKQVDALFEKVLREQS